MLGGDVTIQAVDLDEETLQLRIKLQGVGSLPENGFEYYTSDMPNNVALPVRQRLIRTNEDWEPRRRQNPIRNRSFNIQVGDREELSGRLQSFAFVGNAVEVLPDSEQPEGPDKP